MQPPQPPPYQGYAPQNPYAQQNPYAPQNPYAAPGPQMYRQNVFVPYGVTAAPLLSPGLRKAKLATGIAQLVTMFIGFGLLIAGGAIGDDTGGIFAAIGGLFLMLWYFLLIATYVVNMVWMYKFWSWIPPDQRHTPMWKKYISPGTAIGFLFIPYFNIYWMFVVNLGIADILERMRVQYPSSKPAAKTKAIMAVVAPLVFFPAAPFVQYMFAKHVEEMAAEMQAQMLGAAHPMAAA